MKQIPLTQGKVAIVDDADHEFMLQLGPWHAVRCGHLFYAVHSFKENGAIRSIKMHRVLLGLTDSKIHTDHRDGNGLNNQRANLRIATRSNNNCNRMQRKLTQTGVCGVSFDPRNRRWQARIGVNGTHKYLGTFDSLEAAKMARRAAELELHGQFSAIRSRKDHKCRPTSPKPAC